LRVKFKSETVVHFDQHKAPIASASLADNGTVHTIRGWRGNVEIVVVGADPRTLGSFEASRKAARAFERPLMTRLVGTQGDLRPGSRLFNDPYSGGRSPL
jgi:hypothetical protein